MTISYRRLNSMILVALLAVIVGACNAIKAPAPDNSVNTLIPKPGGYTFTDITQYSGNLSNLLAGAAAASGNIPASLTVKTVEKLFDCYKKAGAFAAGAYVNTANPILIGTTLIINKSVVTNPQTLIGCFNETKPQDNGLGGGQSAGPCAFLYDFPYDNKTFTAFVAGSDSQVCTALCSSLPNQCIQK